MDQQKEWSQFTAPEYGEILTLVRLRLDKTQMEMADLLDAGFTTYRKWEWGERKPRAGSRRLIREKFEETLYALGVLKREDDQESKMPLSESEEQQAIADQKTTESPGPVVEEHSQSCLDSGESVDGAVVYTPEDTVVARTFIASNMTMHLLDLAHTEYYTSSDKPDPIQQAIKKFDTMNTTNKNYQMTRRDATASLATFPMIALRLQPPGSMVQSTQYGDAIAFCTAALEGCWQLYRSSDASNVQLAFQCVSKYLSVLDAIAKDSALYRKEALDLATRYALIKTKLGFQRVETTEAVRYAEKALALSKATGDILLQLSAYAKLAWAYFYDKKYSQAYKKMLEGESVLKGYQHMRNMPPLPSCVIGNFNSTYSLIQANNGISSDTAFGIATNIEPTNELIAFMQFTLSAQLLEAAWTCCSKGDSAQAMLWLRKRMNLETLAPNQDVPQSEHGRIATINILTRSLLQLEEPDMGSVIKAWTAGIKGAKALRSEQRYRDAMIHFETMRVMWPSEKSIMELFPLTKHWSEEE